MFSNRLHSTLTDPLALRAGVIAGLLLVACSSPNDTTPTRGDGVSVGGNGNSGGAAGSGGSVAANTAGQTALAGSSAAGSIVGGTAAAGGSTSGGAKATGGVVATAGANCVTAAPPSLATMNPGQACTSCHSGTSPSGGVLITLGGTLFSAASAGSAVSGATVTITDSNNVVTKLVTGPEGNFYTNSTIAFPAKVSVSKCPDTASMASTVTSGNCNSCHGSSMQIHLP